MLIVSLNGPSFQSLELTHEKNAEVGLYRAGVVAVVHLEEGDHHQDEAVGGQAAGEHLGTESAWSQLLLGSSSPH